MATKEEKAAAKAAKDAAKITAALTDGLKAAGVALTGNETPAEIQTLADTHGVKVITPEAAKAAAAKAPAEAPTVAMGVYDDSGKFVRAYSLADHGENYKELAEQFISDRKGYTTKPLTIELNREPQPADTEFVRVLGPSGDVVRVYSKSQHGDDYKALADQFLAKFPNRQYKLAK